MDDRIFDLLTQLQPIKLKDCEYSTKDEMLCDNICARINYIKRLYQYYKKEHPDANFANDNVIKEYYRRLKLITPPFVLEGK